MRSCSRMGDDDPTTWQVALALGLGIMTYGSTNALRPPPRELLVPPSTPAHCVHCISSYTEGAAVSISRQLDTWVRATILTQADRAPLFDDRLYITAAGVGVSSLTPDAPFGGHIDLVCGAAWVRGPVDATSIVFGFAMGADVHVADDLYVGLAGTYLQFFGPQAAGSGAISNYGIELRYRWR
jgi:hypothetical protein